MILPDSARVEVTDTFFPIAYGLNGAGDSIAAPAFWTSVDTTILKVLDSASGKSLGRAVGIARLQARVETLNSNLHNVSVIARLDSMAYVDRQVDTLDVTPGDSNVVDSLSNPLSIRTIAFGGNASSRRVVYTFTTYPDSNRVVTLVPNDTVTTSADGTASVQVRLRPGLLPDSVVLHAAMQRFHGGALPGSPLKFVVEFRP